MRKNSREMKYSRFSYRVMLLMPIAVLILSLVTSVMYNYYASKKLLIEFSISELSNMTKVSESKIASVVTTVKSFDKSSTISKYLAERDVPFDDECINSLKDISGIFDYIDEISIFDKINNRVCSTSGVYDAYNYFTNIYKYSEQNYNYWTNIRFYISDEYRVLQPTAVTDESGKAKTVLPVVYRRHNNFLMKNLLIINIDLEDFLAYERSGEIVPEFSSYLFNKLTHDIFTWDGKVISADTFPSEFYSKLLNSSDGEFSCELNGKGVVVITNSLSDTLYGYTYCSIIDKIKIAKSMLPSLSLSMVILVVFILLYYIVFMPSITYVYNPIYNINRLLTKSSMGDANDSGIKRKTDYLLCNIDDKIANLKEKNDYLFYTLQCAQEKYLFDFINSRDYYIDKKIKRILQESFSFENENFAMVLTLFQQCLRVIIIPYLVLSNLSNDSM